MTTGRGRTWIEFKLFVLQSIGQARTWLTQRLGSAGIGILGFVASVIMVVLLSRAFPGIAAALWSAWLLDAVAVITLASAFWLGIRTLKLANVERENFVKSYLFKAVGGLVLISSFYVTYASFRNQTRIAAETALNQEGMALYAIEMSSPELRCIYYNYRPGNDDLCLSNLIKSQDNWSKAIFYVEEGWFILKQAGKDRREWGSTYAESIKYWAEDVSIDPTGLFSYYLVSGEDTLADAKKVMSGAGVDIKDICGKYAHVWRALQAARLKPRRQMLSGAVWECLARYPRYFRQPATHPHRLLPVRRNP